MDLEIYPEGGDLVAGLSSRVYFEARTPAKKPADIAGMVVDGRGKQVALFATEHEGRGRFELTPVAGETYRLKITRPSGIRTTFPLPGAKAEGAVLRAVKDRCAAGEAVQFLVASRARREQSTVVGRSWGVAESSTRTRAPSYHAPSFGGMAA